MPAKHVFLDSSGRAPVSPRTAEALSAGLADGWADPARLSSESRRARALLDGSTEAIAAVLGVSPANVHFMPSPAIAAERVVSGILRARRGKSHIVSTPVERRAVLDAVEFASPGNAELMPVDAHGRVDLPALQSALASPEVALAAIQHANQETGTIQPLSEIASLAASTRVPLVVDASASIGHVDAPEHWDALLADPADWGAPAGLGVLAVRERTRWLPAWPGDSWVPGGVSIPLALATAVALQERYEELQPTEARLRTLTDRIGAALSTLEGVSVVGDPDDRLPHLLTAAFMYLDGEPVVTALAREGFSVGSGSVCGTAAFEPSHVLAAMGALTHGNLRIGLHPGVSDNDVDRFVETVPRVLEDVRRGMVSH